MNKPYKIGIIGAMDVEVADLIQNLKVEKTAVKANMKFYEGKIGELDVVVVRCGIGKVNAALCVQILADLFAITHIINTGAAGSLNPSLNIGDVLISKDVVYHDVDVRMLGYDLGQVPQLDTWSFTADAALMNLAIQTCRDVFPNTPVTTGRVLSGDQFICEDAVKNRLLTTFQGDCTEMEGASIAHGAYLNEIPFLIIRSISDKADGSDFMDYAEFERAAGERSAQLVIALIKRLGSPLCSMEGFSKPKQ
ncbi:MAG: 5'-methylthioadenosine/adenosylhomocysteine nucleosidase [Lachnospiraceae bacterium]|jgi:adenosylhomocysteine nucleosidase|nr:5'-methylthioadenosine/adenosylhomocysteine nucleosidase [Lachnospiraceae bacterium]